MRQVGKKLGKEIETGKTKKLVKIKQYEERKKRVDKRIKQEK